MHKRPVDPGGRSVKVFYIIALLVTLPLVSEVHGTTIIGIRTPESVVIAADSMGTFRGGGLPEYIRKVCKIFNVQGAGFAISGLIKDPKRDLDLEREIAEVVWNRYPIHKAAALIEYRLKDLLSAELDRLKQENQALFLKTITGEGGYVTSFILATIEDGKPFAVGVGFQAKELPNGRIEIKPSRISCPGDCDGGVYMFMLGEQGPINTYIKEHGEKFKMSPVDGAKFLVQLVIEAMPEKVGPPIDVLVVAPNGIFWHSKKMECGGFPSGFREPNANH